MTSTTQRSTPNPWSDFSPSERNVLEVDKKAVEAHNDRRTADSATRFELNLMPEPYFGRPDAPVVLLALNPGVHPCDHVVHRQPWFVARAAGSLTHSLAQHEPFLHLGADHADTPGGRWWRRITGPLLADDLTIENIARGVLCLQLYPYHSKKFAGPARPLPSFIYTAALLNDAIDRCAMVVVMRSGRRWREAVPRLNGYPHRICVANPLNPTLSPANLGDGFNIIRAALLQGSTGCSCKCYG